MLNRLGAVFESLQRHDVRYVVIGGIAAILHGVPRATFDLDILIDPSAENARKLLDAFLDAGIGTASLTTAEEVLENEITVFKDRVRIDVMTATPGVSFADAWEHRVSMSYQGRAFPVLSRVHVIQAKRAAGRPQDLEDVCALELSPTSAERTTT